MLLHQEIAERRRMRREGTSRNQSETLGFTQAWKFAAAQIGLCHVIFIMFILATFALMKGQNPQTTASFCLEFAVDLFHVMFFWQLDFLPLANRLNKRMRHMPLSPSVRPGCPKLPSTYERMV